MAHKIACTRFEENIKPEKSVRVLLLGGTGAMGSHLATLLAKDSVEVTITSRTRSGESGGIRYLKGNAHDENFLSEVLREPWDAIVDFMVYKTSTFAGRINQLLDSTDQYLFISSARVYADSVIPITESAPRLLDVSTDKEFLATDEYALTKARQENLLNSSGRNNWTIIRPYITYGEARLQLGVSEKEGWLYRAIRGRTIVFSSNVAEKITTLTYGADVSRGIRAVIGQSSALGEAFHITSDNKIKWKNVLSIYSDVLERNLGKRPKAILQTAQSFDRTRSAKYQFKYDRIFDRVFDNSKIRQYLDTSTFIVPEVGLKQCLEAFLVAPKFSNINWRDEAEKDRYAKENSLKEIKSGKHAIQYMLYRYIIH